ncbi:hypothetical protein QBC32DRAFT_363868 [Pseudoneurospora amorphoporcata]|uniref:Putative zinc-finger domain-containing protein n=1 Tax=Pseudoneurospora amorphoporcata TaxID=241081 RepID=A0AAN6NPZ5_9PEZI|nr:hypothetical protein QBC32DRAFT_363868 [Pseudoneurospora amorphoporcata]
MSQYPPYPGPYNGYGQYQAQPPPQPPPQPPYGYQHPPPNYSVHPPITGPPPYNATPVYQPSGQPGFGMDTNRNLLQGAFDYNSMQIPGLGFGGPPATSTPFGAPPIPSPWGQPPPSFQNHQPPPMMPQQPAQPHAPRVFGGFSGPSQPAAAGPSSNGPGNRPANLPPKLPPKPPARVTKPIEIEEGELSEGQFEDLYEPAPPITVNTNVKKAPKSAPAPVESQPTSAVDTPDANFYGNDEDEGEIPAKDDQSGVPASARERSGSYSPFLSPRELQSGIPTPQNGDRSIQAPQAVPDRTKATGIANGRASLVPGLQFASSSSFGNSTSAEQATPATKNTPCSSPAPKTLQTVQKEAQLAILRLLPLGVKYQHYIEEGIDEKVVKKLYNNLHLDIPKPASETTTTTTSTQKAGPEKMSSPVPTSPQTTKVQQQQPAPAVSDTAPASEQPSKEESRKDRIARLMAAKAEKATKPSAVPALKPPSAPAPKMAPTPVAMTQLNPGFAEAKGAPAVVQEKPAGDAAAPKPKLGPKELLLQQKIAALQKSREAQKQGQANIKSQAATTGLADKAISSPIPNIAASAGLKNGIPQPQAQANVPVAVSTIPGLQFSGTPNVQPAPPANPRKRPVAADFVEYSSAAASLPKRPFGQIRKETSLVIDVTDGSDDEDMDIDMDMESPTDVTQPTQSVNGNLQRGGPLRDFPPLTDTLPPRQFSSPVPGAQASNPPATAQNIRRRETELDVKERMIQEMRRKIAEAEAKRKAKKSSAGSQTPTHPEQTPELKDDGGFRLPTTRQSVSTSSTGPSSITTPVRPASAAPVLSSPSLPEPPKPSPTAKAALEAKMNRLRQLREEQARLEAEINGFSEEPEQPDTNSMEVPAQSSDSNKDTTSVSVHPTIESQNDLDPSNPQVFSEPSESLKGSSTIIRAEDKSSESSSILIPAADGQEAAASAETAEQDDQMSAMSIGEGEELESDQGNHSNNRPTDVSEGIPTAQLANKVDDGESQAQRENTPAKLDETSPMETDSSPSSPTSLESSPEDNNNDSQSSLPEQISLVAQPREADQELEDEPARDVNVVSPEVSVPVQLTRSQETHKTTTAKTGSFKPYESPLRYFHAYRFHPSYRDTVPGGLRSLTYSNRINPSIPLCPSEIAGEQCDETCEFQHMKSIVAPDDAILLELGKADEFAGEQKTRFIDGLRKLLHEFRAKKVRDFDAIARGIIEYRARFLGDRSKVLPLEGVTL